MLACCYDAGYIPYLGKFAAEKRLSDRITLIEGSLPLSRPKGVGFQTVKFDNIFVAKQNIQESSTKLSMTIQPYSYPGAKLERLGSILHNAQGKRIDRPLSVRPEVIKQLERENLCYYLFLRGECREKCSRKHISHLLSDEEWDALWFLARRGRCYRSRKDNNCNDSKCVYSHTF
jgi:hypothetical protein